MLYETTLSLIVQPRTAGSRPYCRRFNACKSGERDGFVSPPNYCVSVTSKQLAIVAFCTRESAMIFLNSPRKRTGSALEIESDM